MKSKKKIARDFKRHARFVFVYSDTQLLEIYQGFHLAAFTPLQLYDIAEFYPRIADVMLVSTIVSAVVGVCYIAAVMLNSLKVRVYASLVYWVICCCILSLLLKSHAMLSSEFLVPYMMQLVFALYIHLRLGKEYRERCKDGNG